MISLIFWPAHDNPINFVQFGFWNSKSYCNKFVFLIFCWFHGTKGGLVCIHTSKYGAYTIHRSNVCKPLNYWTQVRLYIFSCSFKEPEGRNYSSKPTICSLFRKHSSERTTSISELLGVERWMKEMCAVICIQQSAQNQTLDYSQRTQKQKYWANNTGCILWALQ